MSHEDLEVFPWEEEVPLAQWEKDHPEDTKAQWEAHAAKVRRIRREREARGEVPPVGGPVS